jgi:hypothetical protein
VALGWSQWALILPLVALPAVVHELTKWAIRWRTIHRELPADARSIG